MSIDRITEAYLGERGDSDRKEAQTRIHWICRTVRGRKILDVGCSQGITTFLLAREGFQVTGVDPSEEALAYAKAALEKESSEVQQRITFVHGTCEKLGDDAFDTAVMGEVLEHVASPDRLLEGVWQHLQPGAQLILTTPFGYHKHDDHKQTFYFDDLLLTVGRWFAGVHLEVHAKYFCYVGRRRDVVADLGLAALRDEIGGDRWVTIVRDALKAREVELTEHLEEVQAKRAGHFEALQQSREALKQAQDERRDLERKLEAERVEQGRLVAAEARLAEMEQERLRLEHAWRDEQQQHLAAEKARAELQAAFREETSKLHVASHAALEALQTELRQSLEGHHRALRELEDASRELANAQQERESAARQRESAAQELGNLTQVVADLRRRLIDAEGTLANERQATAALRKAAAAAQSAHQTLERSHAQARKSVAELQQAFEEMRNDRDHLKRLANSFKKQLKHARDQADNVTARWRLAERRHQEVLETNRYQLGQAVWEALRSPSQAVRLPQRIAGIAASTLQKRIAPPGPPLLTPAPTHEPAPLPSGSARAPRPTTENTPSPRLTPPKKPSAAPNQRAVEVDVRVVGRAQRPSTPRDVWMAAILDDMSAACFAPDCNLITFSPSSWREVLEERPPHLLFVESAWKGNGGSWQYKVGRYNHPDAGGLSELVSWCRSHGIPTVFWNKEDPVHFDKFKDAAALFDIVFTTDANSIERYRALQPSKIRLVDALPFAAQPRLHHPASSAERSLAPCFAGSYYGNRHLDRRAQQEMLLDAAREFGLVIYDRNHGSQDPAFIFPERFAPHMQGGLPYEQLCEVYRRHAVFLNVNSVTESPTMLSRRVFELLACGTVVVSTPSKALENIFGDLVPVVSSSAEARDCLAALLESPARRADLAARGLRFVHAAHTYRQRIATIMDAVGLGHPALTHEPASAVAIARTRSEVEWLTSAFSEQSKRLGQILIGVPEDLEVELRPTADLPDLRLVRQPSALDDVSRHRQLAEVASTRHVFVLRAGHRIDRFFVEDLLACTAFVDADVVGESSSGAREHGHRFVTALEPGAVLIQRELLRTLGWRGGRQEDTAWLTEFFARGVRLYAARAPGLRATQDHPTRAASSRS